jgi:inosine/xanthosine triphosphatase
LKINVGSINQIKVNAVRAVIKSYARFAGAIVDSIDSSSDVSEQPHSLSEIIAGARNRARNAFNDYCQYSFGIEDGLMPVPYARNGYMNICACVIFDGNNYYQGLSPAFELPNSVIKLIINNGLDMSQAFHRSGLSDKEKLGAAEGAVGLLTEGRLQRQEYTQIAITMALLNFRIADIERAEH